jgi:hypothetical protein
MKLILAFILAAGAVSIAVAQSLTAFGTAGTDIGNTLNYAVISAHGQNQAAPLVKFVSVTSDKTAAVLTFYTVGAPVQSISGNTSISNLVVASTNGFLENDIVVIRHIASDTYERRVVHAVSSSTNLTIKSPLTAATVAGDLVYKATAAGTIPVGNATVTLSGAGIWAGQRGRPLLLEVDGTSACHINAVGGIYVE